jgi:protein-S-isoprenylcysteine O-methyltransferase Ste14
LIYWRNASGPSACADPATSPFAIEIPDDPIEMNHNEAEPLFRAVFATYYVATLAIALSFRRKARQQQSGSATQRKASKERRAARILRRVAGILMIAVAVSYSIGLPFVTRFAAPVPFGVRICVLPLAIANIPLLVVVLRALGRQWSTKLEIQSKHRLITSGPYRWVRHPLYAVIFLTMFSLAGIAANWLFIIPALAAATTIYLRISEEERMMVKEFPEDYPAYMRRTGRILPPLFR